MIKEKCNRCGTLLGKESKKLNRNFAEIVKRNLICLNDHSN
jgi:hypothetical protein